MAALRSTWTATRRSLAAFRFALTAGDLPEADGPAALRAAFDLPDPEMAGEPQSR